MAEIFPGEKEQNALRIIQDALQNFPESDGQADSENTAPIGPSCLILFTDGGAHGNPGPGAWAALLQDAQNQVITEASGSSYDTTNNRMELQAVIEGLKAALAYFEERQIKKREVSLFSDSQIVVKGITQWLAAWKQKNWKKADGQPVANMALWQEIDTLATQIKVHAAWVRGHNGQPQNEYCDKLVQKAIAELEGK